jgi:hyperosmotically inducible protein
MSSKFLIGALSVAMSFAMAAGMRAAGVDGDEPPAPAAGQDQSAQPGTDAWITTQVKADLMTTKDVPGTAISVSTMNGVVTLAGIVDNRAQVQKSIAVAKAIKGVRDVDSTALNPRNN